MTNNLPEPTASTSTENKDGSSIETMEIKNLAPERLMHQLKQKGYRITSTDEPYQLVVCARKIRNKKPETTERNYKHWNALTFERWSTMDKDKIDDKTGKPKKPFQFDITLRNLPLLIEALNSIYSDNKHLFE